MPSRASTDYAVYLDGVSAPAHKVISMAESAGSERLDVATLEVNISTLDNFAASDYMNVEIEIVDGTEVVHWGKVTQVPIVIQPKGETLQVTSRTELYHLGGKIDGYYVWDPIAGAIQHVDGELIFNPLIDGLVYGNRNATLTTNGVSPGRPIFLDPESVRTTAAQSFQGAVLGSWDLAQAVEFLLWSLNDETYVANVSAANLADVFDDPNAVIRDVRIPRGTYLAEALDLLIVPLGYQWRVSRTALGSRTYAFWKRGAGGTLRTVKHQAWGSDLDLDEQNTETAGVTFDISSLANQITILGGFGEYEMTVELLRAWPAADDPVAGIADELAKDNPDFDNKRNVLRKWVLNEAGDYIGLRTEIDGLFTSDLRAALTSAGILHEFVGRRRRLLPTLTLDGDGAPIGRISGVEVEYANEGGGSPTWLPVDLLDVGCSLLEKEAGVYFDSNRLPEEFLFNPADLRIRATFTLQNDLRLTGYADRQVDSPNEDVVPVVVSAPDRFRYRDRSLSKYDGGALPSLTVNDTTAIANFAAYVRDKWDVMRCGGAIQLEGLDHTYLVGDRVEKIEGKEISFEAKAASGIYPQIVAIERNVTQQVMVLHLDHFRDPLTLPTPSRGTSKRFAPQNFKGRTI
ncbi:MAG: hypothetical protein AB7G28_20635 [Pirellulales bacterium]